MPPPPPAVPQTAPDPITRHLDADELASLLKRGEELINSGDLASARLVLRRAAEAGDTRAALQLAGTYDPNLLEKFGFQEHAADVAMARLWYQRAAQFGSAEAPRRLQQLTTKTNSVP
jgi:TPR repeat protein